MTKEEMIQEAEAVIGKANIKLVDICGDKKPLTDVILTMSAGNPVRIKSGFAEIASFDGIGLAAFKAAKRAIWHVVDKTRDEIQGSQMDTRVHGPRLEIHTQESAYEAVKNLIEQANLRLKEIVAGNYPFTFDEVEFSCETDTAYVYVRSGRTPICVVARERSPQRVFCEIREEIWKTVDATRNAVDRRKAIKEDADKLETDCRLLQQAADALTAVGLPAEILGICDPSASKAIVEAAQKACRAANRALCLRAGTACEAIYGGYSNAKFVVKGFVSGIVILAGGKPCLVSRFPKTSNNTTIEKTVVFIENDIKALNESRMAYILGVQKKMDEEEAARALAAKIANAYRLVKEA